MNHFDSLDVAQRYRKGRPYFHPLIMDKIRTHLSLTGMLAQAIDVGCGTGLSTIALKQIAKHIVGIDPAQDMLDVAPHDASINYICAPAENLPVLDNFADLITVSSAFYWFNRPRFFEETRRVLHNRGWLIIYDNAFSGSMVGNSQFAQWFHDFYLHEYPYPSNLPSLPPLQEAEVATWGFQLQQEQYENIWCFSQPELREYLLSLSNITERINKDGKDASQIAEELMEQIAPFFYEERPNFFFHGPILYLHYIDD